MQDTELFSQEMEDACNGMIQPLDVSQQQSVDDLPRTTFIHRFVDR